MFTPSEGQELYWSCFKGNVGETSERREQWRCMYFIQLLSQACGPEKGSKRSVWLHDNRDNVCISFSNKCHKRVDQKKEARGLFGCMITEIMYASHSVINVTTGWPRKGSKRSVWLHINRDNVCISFSNKCHNRVEQKKEVEVCEVGE